MFVKHSFKHILLVNTKGSGMAKLRRKPSPTKNIDLPPVLDETLE